MGGDNRHASTESGRKATRKICEWSPNRQDIGRAKIKKQSGGQRIMGRGSGGSSWFLSRLRPIGFLPRASRLIFALPLFLRGRDNTVLSLLQDER